MASKIIYKDWSEIGKVKFKRSGIKPIDIIYVRFNSESEVLIGWYAKVDGKYYGNHASTNDPALADLPLNKQINDITVIMDQNARQTLQALTDNNDKKS